MTRETQAVGRYGEGVAARYLVQQGLVVLDRNWRCRHGEVDLILRDADDVVFCEVKTRRGTAFGSPAEAVVRAKALRLRRIVPCWLAEAGVHPHGIRFDVVEVLPQRRGRPRVEHIRSAF